MSDQKRITYYLVTRVGDEPAQALMSGPAAGSGMGASLLALSAYIFLSTLTPPLFLIAAVSAENFGEFLSAAH